MRRDSDTFGRLCRMGDSSSAQIGSILLTPNERREGRPDCFWLYVVTNCASAPQF